MRFKSDIFTGWFMIINGIFGLILNLSFLKLEYEKYIWPFFIVGVGLLYIIINLYSNYTGGREKLKGLIIGTFFSFYGLFFYITLIFNLRWIYITFLLFCLAGGGSVIKGSGGKGDKAEEYSGDFGEHHREQTVSDQFSERELILEQDKEVQGGEKNLKLVQKKLKIKKRAAEQTGNYRINKFVLNIIGLVGLFSVFYLTLSYGYHTENYTGNLYPLVLLLSGIYILKKAAELKRRYGKYYIKG